jgi:hypothetical protein
LNDAQIKLLRKVSLHLGDVIDVIYDYLKDCPPPSKIPTNLEDHLYETLTAHRQLSSNLVSFLGMYMNERDIPEED